MKYLEGDERCCGYLEENGLLERGREKRVRCKSNTGFWMCHGDLCNFCVTVEATGTVCLRICDCDFEVDKILVFN